MTSTSSISQGFLAGEILRQIEVGVEVEVEVEVELLKLIVGMVGRHPHIIKTEALVVVGGWEVEKRTSELLLRVDNTFRELLICIRFCL